MHVIWNKKYNTLERTLGITKVGFTADLVFFVCYFHCAQHRVLCLTLTASSLAGFLSPGPRAEGQSKLFSAPPHHNLSHAFGVNEHGPDQAAPGFPNVSE